MAKILLVLIMSLRKLLDLCSPKRKRLIIIWPLRLPNGISTPPSTPHFEGLWEAGVKYLKFHLRRVIGDTLLCYEEFVALVVQTEAVLNSRSLCPFSSNPNDLEVITRLLIF